MVKIKTKRDHTPPLIYDNFKIYDFFGKIAANTIDNFLKAFKTALNCLKNERGDGKGAIYATEQ